MIPALYRLVHRSENEGMHEVFHSRPCTFTRHVNDIASFAVAHGVDDNTRTFLQQNTGVQFVPFLYIGAKHMITGYDHLLFLLG